MLAYKFKEDTKEFLYAQEAQRNPLEGGYLLPANCTFKEVPEYQEKQIPVFNEEDDIWEIKQDHRGHYEVNLEDLTVQIVNYIGNPQEGYQFISDYDYQRFIEDKDRYKVIDGVFTDISETEEYAEIKREKERQRIANLTMTALDFIGVLQELGLTLIQINDYLESHLDLKMQLTYCQNVYCGVVCQLCPLTVDGITLTKEIVIQAFKNKHGEN